jgi:hypothetical protein
VNVTENLLLSQAVTVSPAIVNGIHLLSNFFLPSFSLGVTYPITRDGSVTLKFSAVEIPLPGIPPRPSPPFAIINNTLKTAVTVHGTVINPLVSAFELDCDAEECSTIYLVNVYILSQGSFTLVETVPPEKQVEVIIPHIPTPLSGVSIGVTSIVFDK